MQRRIASLALAGAATFAPAVAHAQDSAGAEALFQKGHQLFEEKKYAEACPKFAESVRLEPTTGSRLALAACHDAEGKLATAWAEYLDVANRARAEGNKERADAAQQRAALLEPKLAKLTVSLAPGAEAIAGLQVKRDGIVIGPGTYGTALPVNRGEHTIEATAPGRQPFSKRVTMVDGAMESVPIPVLGESATPPPNAPPPSVAPPGAEAPPKEASPFPLRTVGIVTAAVGVVTIGIGSVFGITAIGKNSDSNTTGCNGDNCTGAGLTNRRDALSAGNTATALFVVGGLLTGGGVLMFVLGGSSSGGSGGESKPAVAAAPAIGPGSAGFALSGRF